MTFQLPGLLHIYSLVEIKLKDCDSHRVYFPILSTRNSPQKCQLLSQFLHLNIGRNISHIFSNILVSLRTIPGYILCYYILSEVAQSCPTLCDPMDCSLPGSSVYGIFQAIVLEQIAIFFSRGSSQPRDGTQVSRIVDRRLTI